MKFRNPANDHVEEKSVPWLWCLLFGGLYFLVSGVWIHTLVMFLVAFSLIAVMGAPAIILVAIMNVVYAMLAGTIIEGYYLRKGWVRMDGSASSGGASAQTNAIAPGASSDSRQCPFCAETIKAAAIVCRYCGKDVPAMGKKSTTPNYDKLSASLAGTENQADQIDERELEMAALGITFDGEKYAFLENRYDKLADAVAYAAKVKS